MLGENIRNYRKQSGLSQDELAEKLNVSRQSTSLWENDQTQPSLENILALAKIFNVSTDKLLEAEGAASGGEANGWTDANDNSQKPNNEEHKNKTVIIIIVLIAIILLLAGILFLTLG